MPDPRPLTEPADGVPQITDTPAALQLVIDAFAAARGPVAVDAERASGYRYGQRGYLVQLRREGAGTALIDPIALPDLAPLAAALGDAEWILHAANQDLPCLAAVGLRPGGDLFDTELAGRLAGFERVGLGAMVENLLGWQLAKEHSAADWSKRPLPVDWLRYAALDVEVLIELRERLVEILTEQGKLDWAREEFAAVRDAAPKPARQDPWRRTSGLHAVKNPRQLAVVRELWAEREKIAQRRDIAPGRILPDRAIVNAAVTMPRTQPALIALPVFSGPANRRQAGRWLAAIQRAVQLPDSALPVLHLPAEGPPPVRAWSDRDPEAAARLSAARDVVTRRANELTMPAENLISPDLIRRLSWSPPREITRASVAEFLTDHGARPWQVDQLAEPLVSALSASTQPDAEQVEVNQ